MTFETLTTAQLKTAIQIREQIDSLQEKLAALMGGEKPAAVTKKKVGRTKGKRTMSPEGRAAIAAAQKARWAKVKT